MTQQVTVVGAGRLGQALAARSLALGYRTRILVRDTLPDRAIAAHRLAEVESTGRAQPRVQDKLVVLAAPALADRAAEAAIGNFVAASPPDQLIASAVAYSDAPHARWGKGRRYVRFLATPAAAKSQAKALLIVDGNAGDCPELAEWFGPATYGWGEGKAFARHMRTLMTTPMHLALLAHTGDEPGLAAATLAEAAALLELTQGNAANAAQLCATPEGHTVRLLDRYQDMLRALDKEVGYDDSL